MTAHEFHLVECAIEVAWQTKDNPRVPRAEFRHELAKIVAAITDNRAWDREEEDLDEKIAEELTARQL